jgi:hypothetical protein
MPRPRITSRLVTAKKMTGSRQGLRLAGAPRTDSGVWRYCTGLLPQTPGQTDVLVKKEKSSLCGHRLAKVRSASST